MKFATILREAGFSTETFKKSAEIPITLYDGKDRKISDEDVHFHEPLFKNYSPAYEQFSYFLADLEKGPTIKHMDVKVDADFIIAFYHSHRCRLFLRNSITTMD